jgi:hypothetical protein
MYTAALKKKKKIDGSIQYWEKEELKTTIFLGSLLTYKHTVLLCAQGKNYKHIYIFDPCVCHVVEIYCTMDAEKN